MKILVLSDLHLGSKASTAVARLADIQRVAASFDRVILNGDTLDRCYIDPASDEKANSLIDDVRCRCAGRNGPPELLTGNHDPAISDAHWVYDEPSSALIFHGDCIRDCTHPSKPDEQRLMVQLHERWDALGGRPANFVSLHANYREIQRAHLPIINPYRKPKTALQYAMSLIYPPRRPFDIIHYWMKAPGRALNIARGFDRPLKHVVFGHTHRAGRWRKDGIDIYNTGSHMPVSEAFTVCIEDERVSYLPLKALIAGAPRAFALGGDGLDADLQSANKKSGLAGGQTAL